MTSSDRRADLGRARQVWADVHEQFTGDDGVDRWDDAEVTWGLFRIPEADVRVLGDVAGRDVAELGCGTAYLSAHLARRGARPVAVDLSRHQLETARRCQDRTGPRFPLIEASAEDLPLPAATFDLVVSEYGAAPWCEPQRWLAEVARILRPGGRLVFLTNSVLAAMCVPAEGGYAGDALLRGHAEVRQVAWDGGGIEFHPGHGEWIRVLRAAGFAIDALHELVPDEAAETPPFYEIVTADWARRWPAEDLWAAHLEP